MVEIIIGYGVLAQVVAYLRNRTYWMDENSLAAVIKHTSWRGLFGPLSEAQLAPVGFLVIEHAASQIQGGDRLGLRLLPLLGGLTSLFLFRKVSSRFLTPRAALIALAMFATSDDVIYFASELKPYSTDLTIALLCTLAGQHAAAGRRSVRSLAWLALTPWFSFPAVFVLAGVGVVLIASAIAKRERCRILELVGIGAIWLVSIAAVQSVAHRQLQNARSMFEFWDFAFPGHAGGLSSITWALRRFAFLFANPLDFSIPGLSAKGPALIVLALFLVGCGVSASRDRRGLGLLSAPLVFAMLAGYLRLYPFHGRLVLFLVPSLLILIAEGAETVVSTVGGNAVKAVLIGFLVVIPAVSAGFYVVEPNRPRIFHAQGDRRPAKLVAEGFPF